jgi:hexokinase
VASSFTGGACAGTNACYIEQLGRITKWLPQYRPRTPDMVVNIEWPGFAAPQLPMLPEDAALDAESNNPGQQLFEKLTAGLYMGDIARRIILRCAAPDQAPACRFVSIRTAAFCSVATAG